MTCSGVGSTATTQSPLVELFSKRSSISCQAMKRGDFKCKKGASSDTLSVYSNQPAQYARSRGYRLTCCELPTSRRLEAQHFIQRLLDEAEERATGPEEVGAPGTPLVARQLLKRIRQTAHGKSERGPPSRCAVLGCVGEDAFESKALPLVKRQSEVMQAIWPESCLHGRAWRFRSGDAWSLG